MSLWSFSFLLGSLLAPNPSAAAVPAAVEVGSAGARLNDQALPSALLTRSLTAGADVYTYQVYVPQQVRGRKDLPVLLFLHGIRQRGVGGYVPTSGPGAALITQYLERVPALVLLPQCPPGRYWHEADVERMVMEALELTVGEFGADRRRVYLAGVSMGAFGVWHLASRHGRVFAALVAVCGGSPLSTGDRYAPIARGVGRTPAWVFHGAEDRVVPVSESRRMVEALRAIEGSRVRYSEYQGAGHDVWLKVLGEAELMPWLLSQRAS